MEVEKRRSFIINFIYFLILAVISVTILKYGLPLLSPFVIAVVISYLLHRPITFISKQTGLNRKLVAVLAVILFYGTIGVLISLLTIKLFASAAQLVGNLPTIYTNHLAQPLQSFFDGLDRLLGQFDTSLLGALQELETQLIQSLGNIVSIISTTAMGFISNVATSLPGLFVEIVLMVISTFFITIDHDKLVGVCLKQLNEKSRTIVLQIKEYVIGTLFVCIRSYLIIMFITFVELSIGLSILGIRHAVLVALCISVFDILPVLGTGGIMLPWTVISLVQGKYSLALGLIIVYVVITVIRNIIEPKIVGSQLGLHPVVTLASMFAGAQLFGVIGLFGFPILLSLLRHLNDNGVIRLFKSDPPDPA